MLEEEAGGLRRAANTSGMQCSDARGDGSGLPSRGRGFQGVVARRRVSTAESQHIFYDHDFEAHGRGYGAQEPQCLKSRPEPQEHLLVCVGQEVSRWGSEASAVLEADVRR